MRTEDYGFVKETPNRGIPMLENTQWVRVNKQCHSLVDDDGRIIAVVFTSYDEDDGDENFIWEVEIEGDEYGSFISLHTAKVAVQQAIRDFEKTQEQKTKTKTRRTTPKKKETEKKTK